MKYYKDTQGVIAATDGEKTIKVFPESKSMIFHNYLDGNLANPNHQYREGDYEKEFKELAGKFCMQISVFLEKGGVANV